MRAERGARGRCDAESACRRRTRLGAKGAAGRTAIAGPGALIERMPRAAHRRMRRQNNRTTGDAGKSACEDRRHGVFCGGVVSRYPATAALRPLPPPAVSGL